MSEPQYKFTRWDYDNDTVQRLTRTGECNGCGACCKAVIDLRSTPLKGGHPKNGGDTTTGKGVWSEIENERGQVRFIQVANIDTDAIAAGHVCSSMEGVGGKGYCNHHFEKTLICSAWPMAPEHVTPFPECSYAFEVTGEWKISELGDEAED